jgi:hypothetical protein
MAFYEEERFPALKPENFFEKFALMGNNHSNLSNEFLGEKRKNIVFRSKRALKLIRQGSGSVIDLTEIHKTHCRTHRNV